jgi:predicted RND superfamily exporter protein
LPSTARTMIERLLRWSYVRRRTVLVAATVLAAVSALLVARVSFDANIVKLLPRRGPAVRSFDAYLEHFGTFDHVYVVFEVPPGSRISDGEDLVDRYVEELRKAPEIASVDAELFDDVKDWNYLFERELLLLGRPAAATALSRLSPNAMADALSRSRDLLAMSSPEVKAYVQQDPLGLLPLLRDRLAGGRGLVSFDPTQKGYVSGDGRSRLVIAKPVRPPFDAAFCKRLFARLATVEAAARAAAAADSDSSSEAGLPQVTVKVAGGYRIALEAERVISRELIVNSAGSLVGLLLLVLVVFRSFWVLLYGAVPLLLAAMLTLGLNGLGGSLSPIAGGSSAMLFGLGIDGVVLIYLRYLEERAAGFNAEDAFGRSAGTASSVVLAYASTAATFFAVLVVDFPSLHDLGLLIGVGILACCGLLLTLLPALVGFTQPSQIRPVTTAWLGRFVERHGRSILVFSVVLTVGLGAAASRLRLNTSLDRLQAHTAGTELEREVADRFSLPRDVILALGQGPTLDPLLESAHRLSVAAARDLPSIIISSPDTVLPPAAEQEQVGDLLKQAHLDSAVVAADLEREAAAEGFRPGALRPFTERLHTMLDPSTRLTYDGLAGHGLSPLVSRYVAPTPQGFLVAVYLYSRNPADLDRLTAVLQSAAPSFHLTGVPVVNRELADRFAPQFLTGLMVGLLLVAFLAYVVFRNVGNILLAFLPTALGFIWSAGLLALAGVEIDLFSMFAALTFIGIATDYAVYVIYRHSIEGTRSMRAVLTTTGAGVLVACGTTLIGFGSLIGSSYGPLRSFGITSVATIASCLVSSLLVLPALLQETRR